MLTQIAALSKQEQERRLAMGGLVRTERVADFARSVLLVVRSEVTDPETWGRIQAGMTEILGKHPAIVDAYEPDC